MIQQEYAKNQNSLCRVSGCDILGNSESAEAKIQALTTDFSELEGEASQQSDCGVSPWLHSSPFHITGHRFYSAAGCY